MLREIKGIWWIVVLCFVPLSWYLGYRVQQSEFGRIALSFGLLFAMYALVLLRLKTEKEVAFFVGVAVLCRLILVFSMPLLSDDYFRFIWDGRLAIQGIHPFDALPSTYAQQGFQVEGLDAELYSRLNSPDYHTIYPPVAQAIFAVSCFIFPQHIEWSAGMMKLLLFAMECGSIWLMCRLVRRFGMALKCVLLYALNPLVIVEITGNLHFEGAMVFFLLLSLWWGVQSRPVLSAGAMALSVASKMVSLLALPFIWRLMGWKRAMGYYVVFGILSLLLFAPLLNGIFLQNFAQSLSLYFRQFEFNAGLFNIVQWLGYIITGKNQLPLIGPLLALMAALAIGLQVIARDKVTWKTLPVALLFAVCTWLLCTTTMHPWYLCLPVALSVFCSYRFAIWWSALAVLSYHKYMSPGQPEISWIIAIEYAVVMGIMIWELARMRQARMGSGGSLFQG